LTFKGGNAKNKCVNVGDINIEMQKSPPLSTLRLGEGF